MSEYLSRADADLLYAPASHDHVLENLGGTELPATRVAVPETVAPSFGDAFTMDEALSSIASQFAGKAPVNHTHTGYAAASHTHSDYATADHGHTPAAIGAAPASHTHDYAAPTHSHAQSEITGLADALAAKANVSAMSGKADLVDGKVPSSQLPSFVDDVVEGANLASFPATGESGKIYVAQDTNKSYRWSGSSYVEISASLALGETSGTAYRGDRGKIAYDHSQNAEVHVTAAQKNSWNSKANGNHSHTPAAIGAAAADHNHSYNDLTDKPVIPTIPAALPANGGDADTVDGKHASDFAAASHTHSPNALLAMASALFFTNANGGVEYYYGADSGKNLLTEMAAWPQGFHTAYSNGSNAGNPKSTESWRIFCHKTSDVIGWVLAFGTSGSVFSNYYDNGWKEWRAIYDALHAPLWTGEMYMTETHTIIPTKTLSNCAHGWLLLWSDYNPGSGVANTDFATTMIPNFAYGGQKWNGGQFLCPVPRYADASGEAIIVKTLQVFDNKLVGSAYNGVSPRNDVVLRAVYEF